MGAEEEDLRPETAKRTYREEESADKTVAFCKAVRLAKKGEDYATELLQPRHSAFAVFDGHSGRSFARAASDALCQRLLADGPPFTREKIVDAFWTLDAEVGMQRGEKSGSTAQVLLVERREGEGGPSMLGTVAWCGDSSLVVTDMRTGSVVFSTTSHTAGPDHQGVDGGTEAKELLVDLVRVREQVEKTRGADANRHKMTEEDIRSALTELGSDAPAWDDERVSLAIRAYARARLIARTHRDPPNSEVSFEAARKRAYVRQREYEHDQNQVWVVSTATTRADPTYNDLQMTRSLGDWKASDMVLPHPEIHTFEVPHGAHMRVVLASDGLWDVCKFAKAASIAAKSSSVKQCASKLIQIAEDDYLSFREHKFMDDDTTVIVVDLVPSGDPVNPQGGCCTLS
ncbi:hypothetical protein AB1Y20_009701 [Prymnesium parvum]|uniref:PPM-type phosphatase domain-containing protein n=1 Tax=Prymnesium parvum TaxID=97485 RepID=A0AB34K596_PRYPA